jgi:hypothetical protein
MEHRSFAPLSQERTWTFRALTCSEEGHSLGIGRLPASSPSVSAPDGPSAFHSAFHSGRGPTGVCHSIWSSETSQRSPTFFMTMRTEYWLGVRSPLEPLAVCWLR